LTEVSLMGFILHHYPILCPPIRGNLKPPAGI
jgi:hypothetical protein